MQRQPLAALLLGLVLLGRPARATDTAPFTLTYHDGRLSARIEGVPLEDVLQALARETGAEIHGEAADPRDVSKRFDALPLPEAIDRLVGNQNFVLHYAPGGRLVAVDLLGAPQPRRRKGPRAAAARAFYRRLVTHPPVEVDGRLAQALGANAVRPSRLLRALARQKDAGLRTDVMAALLAAIEEDETLLDAAKKMRPMDFATFFRRRVGIRAEELASYVAEHAKDPLLGRKATNALKRLRTEGANSAG